MKHAKGAACAAPDRRSLVLIVIFVGLRCEGDQLGCADGEVELDAKDFVAAAVLPGVFENRANAGVLCDFLAVFDVSVWYVEDVACHLFSPCFDGEYLDGCQNRPQTEMREGPLACEWKPYFCLLRFTKDIVALTSGRGFDSEPKGRSILVPVIPITKKQVVNK